MIWVNGDIATHLPVMDRGLLYGDGVWETIGVEQGKPQLFDWHLQRLIAGLQALNIRFPDLEALRSEIFNVCLAQERAVLKLIVTRGTGQRGYNSQTTAEPTRILQLSAWANYPVSYAEQGIRLTLCETRLAHQPRLAGFKHLNRLEQVLARAEFSSDYQEGLVRDYCGNVIEGTMSNLFVVCADGSVCTPDLTHCGIAGVMRRYIIQTLEKFGYQCHIHALTLQDIAQAHALFMTNSLIGLWPVREFSGKQYTIPPLLRDLQAAIHTLA
ncbi:MAG: aminodeoxychorismate lyase [Thiothrix lacustris]|uniref:Aminodeoxychorismate lyase n=1 Tax=Thiothrix lacustris TaxID=525917 RepID=A0A1Y1QVP5_9GAMM|nr:MAG: aminodeoxychorismate lyase [Thiothrix lacustris]